MWTMSVNNLIPTYAVTGVIEIMYIFVGQSVEDLFRYKQADVCYPEQSAVFALSKIIKAKKGD